MKQKELTEEQKKAAADLRIAINMAIRADLQLVCDTTDGALCVFNGNLRTRLTEDRTENSEPFDWNKTECLTLGVYTSNSDFDNLYIISNE